MKFFVSIAYLFPLCPLFKYLFPDSYNFWNVFLIFFFPINDSSCILMHALSIALEEMRGKKAPCFFTGGSYHNPEIVRFDTDIEKSRT